MVQLGMCYLNGRRCAKPQKKVSPGDKVMLVFPDDFEAEEKKNWMKGREEFPSSRILYEDSGLIAVDKPPHLPTHATKDPSRPNLYGSVQALLNRRENRSVYLGLHHRLDVQTSGVVLMTKKKSLNAAVTDMFKNRKIKKVYRALLEGVPREASFQRESILIRPEGSKKVKEIKSQDLSKGRPALTEFKVQKKWEIGGKRYTEVICYPKTGRTHQIRVHAAGCSFPIVGDHLYGAKIQAPRVMLHAEQLQFTHPETNKTIRVRAELPEDFVFLTK
jgi:RluA family pseudouridine synthase